MAPLPGRQTWPCRRTSPKRSAGKDSRSSQPGGRKGAPLFLSWGMRCCISAPMWELQKALLPRCAMREASEEVDASESFLRCLDWALRGGQGGGAQRREGGGEGGGAQRLEGGL